MEAGNPAPAGVSILPKSSLATRSRKPRIRRVFPDQGNRWIGWKEEAPHPQGLLPPLFPRRRAALFTSGRGVGGGFVGAGCQRTVSS